VRQAFLSPYKRFVRMVEEQVAKRASAADDKAKKVVDEHAEATARSGATEPAAAQPPKKLDIGTVAAIGVAVGGFATFCSSVFATFLGLGMWMPLGLVALVLAISGPAMVIAWLKLSERNIGPILDANGWAVNAFARINVPFGGALTHVATLPKGAIRSLDDPFAEKKPPVARYVAAGTFILLTILWTLGQLDAFLPSGAKKDSVFSKGPPSHAAPAPSR
jgi:predicted NBD/HSP70 family sugar kinase